MNLPPKDKRPFPWQETAFLSFLDIKLDLHLTSFSVDEYYWEDRPRYYAALDGVRQSGEDLTAWLEYCAAGLRKTLEQAWLRIQTLQVKSVEKLALRPRQVQLLHLLRDHGSMAPGDIWKSLGVSRQGAMDP